MQQMLHPGVGSVRIRLGKHALVHTCSELDLTGCGGPRHLHLSYIVAVPLKC
jgi:hypothetical protein